MMKRSIYLILVVSFFFLQGAVWRSYLTDQDISSLKTDAFYYFKGKLYFISNSGRLFIYDGKKIREKKWFQSWDPPKYQYSALCVGERGIFIGTKKSGLIWLERGNVKRYNSSNSKILREPIQKILIDSTKRIILVHQKGISIGRVNGKEIFWENFKFSGFSLINDLAVDSSGYFWVATNNGLFVYGGKEVFHFTKSDGLPAQNILKIVLQEKKNRMWVYGKDLFFPAGIAFWNGKTWIRTQLPPQVEANDIAVKGDVLWVATNKGIFKYVKGQWSYFGKEDGLAGNEVLRILTTNDNIYFRAYGDNKGFIGELNKYFLE